MKKSIWVSVLVLLVVVCVCIGLLLLAGVGTFFISKGNTSVSVPANVTAAPTDLPALPTSPTNPALSADVTRQMDEIQRQVVMLRGLMPTQGIIRKTLNAAELKQKVSDDFFKDYTQQNAADDNVVLNGFGLLPKGLNLYKLYIDLYSEQIAGFYDDKTKEMYVVQGEGFNGTERMTYSHEYTHALQDQNYDLQNGLKSNKDYCKTHSEYCAAAQALIEGDATLTEQNWLVRFSTPKDKKDIQNFYKTYSSPVYDSAPEYMKADFLFPYQTGLEFVQSLYDRAGYSAVNDAFKNPPVSTEQILHPEKYPSDKPMDVPLPKLEDTLGKGWRELDKGELGEWYTYLMLAKSAQVSLRLPEKDARQAAAGWGGDSYGIYQNDAGQVVLAYRSRWDTSTDQDEFFKTFSQYAKLRWGKPDAESTQKLTWNSSPDGVVTLLRSGADVVWLMTPDALTGGKILSVLPDFQKE